MLDIYVKYLNMIEIKNIVFEYPGIRAIDNISLKIVTGDITALVGPNGAGKTTLMRCIAALETPLSGAITVAGIDVVQNPRLCHRKMGYLADFFGLYRTLSVRQCLTYFARAQLIPANEQAGAVELAAKRLGLLDRLDHFAGSLSRGLAQRLAIAQAIIHEPEVVILDEPASGLDPEARQALSHLFLELKRQGMTLVISSHILSELEEYTDHMVIVKNGKIAKQAELNHQLQQKIIVNLTTHESHDDLVSIIMTMSDIKIISSESKSCRLQMDKDSYQQSMLLGMLVEKGITVCQFSIEKSSLQDAYLDAVASPGEE